MTNTSFRIFISYTHVESAFADRLKADLHQRGQRSSPVWNVLGLQWQEVLHA